MDIFEDKELIQNRYDIAIERIRAIEQEDAVAKPFREYFTSVASFILTVDEFYSNQKAIFEQSLADQKKWNHRLYADILPENYDHSYGNPTYACANLGKEYGQILCAVYAEIRGMIGFAFENRLWDLTVLCELFLEIYTDFQQEELPAPENIQKIFYWYVSDYSEEMVTYRTRQTIDPDCDFATRIIMDSDLRDLRYLYRFGEYITENELGTASFLNSLPKEEIEAMARTMTDAFRTGFLRYGKDISKKRVVQIRYNLGFERILRQALIYFEEMGFRPTIARYATHVINKRQSKRIGFTGAVANKQYDYDHRNDDALFLDEDFVQRKLRVLQNAYEQYADWARVFGGPTLLEIFGEAPFVPESKEEVLSLSEQQQKRKVSMDNQAMQITQRYLKEDESSFTIIAYPIPEIGPDYEEIFKATVEINTLDYHTYENIQQKMIDVLDLGKEVHIKGTNGNHTDLTVALHPLNNPEKETIFENCVADVNIPVGEVFTSPQLTGTNGVLHVTGVYLFELYYKDLSLTFTDGKITDYTCKNFDTEEANKKFIEENLMAHHPWLPLGEFAIGTNTTAYVMAKKFKIEDKMPILIAEKTGPHFAVGDTCFSWEEDNATYNPDGKEIIARDNEVSRLRDTDLSKAYMGCHTDITIPYEELEHIKVIPREGEPISIIENGRFVLPGTEELNKPLKEDLSWQK